MYNDELKHFGVKGMKWGVRHYQDKKGRLTSAGKKRYSDNSKRKKNDTIDSNKKKFQLTDKQKKYIKIGAAAATTALVAYGAYKLYKNKDVIAMKANIGKKNVNFIKDNLDYNDLDSTLGFKFKKQKISIQEDVKNINPKYSIFNSKYNMNCGNCSIAFEMRRRGYDVEANPNSLGMKISNLGEFFSGLKSESFIQMDIPNLIQNAKPTTQRGKDIEKLISSNIAKAYEGDASGSLFFPHTYGSHWINWVKEGDKVSFYDGQNPKIDLVNDLFAHYKYNPNTFEANLTSVRLDNLQINPSINKMVKNVGSKNMVMEFNPFLDRGKNFITGNYI